MDGQTTPQKRHPVVAPRAFSPISSHQALSVVMDPAPETVADATSATTDNLQNRAGESDSPYIRHHAETPVNWQLLDRTTLGWAVSKNKPIFMHIGFSGDHHCRLTTQDSFSNPTVAEFLNEHFVPIIVDRDERPDLDNIFQNYSEAVNASAGWPLTLFLTPDLYPIYGGTYWPGPGTEHSALLVGDSGEEGYSDFLALAKKMHKFWDEQEERCRVEAFEMLHKLQDFAQEGTYGANATAPAPVAATAAEQTASTAVSSEKSVDLELDLDQLDEALEKIHKMFDQVDFGFGTPKFPNPARLTFLLRLSHFPQEVRDVVGDDGVTKATSMALRTLRRIRDGGLRDHLGAGFMRFSVTSDWNLPHFEKMVVDNALLLEVFLDAWLGHAADKKRGPRLDDEFADVVLELGDYLSSAPIRLENGGFATSEASDSYHRRGDRYMREGAYYLWTRREVEDVLATDADERHSSAVAMAYWNVRADGNISPDQDPCDEFLNQNVLSVKSSIAAVSAQFGIPASEGARIISSAREKLRAHREKERPRPAVDDKVVAGANGMVISALSRAAGALRELDPQRSEKYLKSATGAARFVKDNLWSKEQQRLHRFWWGSASKTLGFADDDALMIEGLLNLYQVTLDPEWLSWATELQQSQIRVFYDEPDSSTPISPRSSHSGGFYSSEIETESPTILRLKSGMDKSQPSTNAVSISNLYRLGALLGNEDFTKLAKETITAFEAEILQYPWLFVSILNNVVTTRLGIRRVTVAKGDDKALQDFYLLPRAEVRVLFLEESRENDIATQMAEVTVNGDESQAKE